MKFEEFGWLTEPFNIFEPCPHHGTKRCGILCDKHPLNQYGAALNIRAHGVPGLIVPDSLGVNPKDILGAKKAPLHLVPPALVLWVSQVLGFSGGLLPSRITGKPKEKVYGPYNWRDNPIKLSIYIDAMERHLLALKDGEWEDPEHGAPHIASIAANCAILLDASELGCMVDDRKWKPGTASRIIANMTLKD
jgi:hypothetical protein